MYCMHVMLNSSLGELHTLFSFFCTAMKWQCANRSICQAVRTHWQVLTTCVFECMCMCSAYSISIHIVLRVFLYSKPMSNFKTCIVNDNKIKTSNSNSKNKNASNWNVSLASKLCVSMAFAHRSIVIEFYNAVQSIIFGTTNSTKRSQIRPMNRFATDRMGEKVI